MKNLKSFEMDKSLVLLTPLQLNQVQGGQEIIDGDYITFTDNKDGFDS